MMMMMMIMMMMIEYDTLADKLKLASYPAALCSCLQAMDGKKKPAEPALPPWKKEQKPDAAARAGESASEFLKRFSNSSFDLLLRQAVPDDPQRHFAEAVQHIAEELEMEHLAERSPSESPSDVREDQEEEQAAQHAADTQAAQNAADNQSAQASEPSQVARLEQQLLRMSEQMNWVVSTMGATMQPQAANPTAGQVASKLAAVKQELVPPWRQPELLPLSAKASASAPLAKAASWAPSAKASSWPSSASAPAWAPADSTSAWSPADSASACTPADSPSSWAPAASASSWAPARGASEQDVPAFTYGPAQDSKRYFDNGN